MTIKCGHFLRNREVYKEKLFAHSFHAVDGEIVHMKLEESGCERQL